MASHNDHSVLAAVRASATGRDDAAADTVRGLLL